MCGDVRTPDKLIDQVNDTSDGRHMWLAPILPGLVSSWGAFVSLVSGTCLSSRAGYPTHQNACGLSGRRRSSLTRLDGPSLGPRERRACGGPRRPRAAGVRRSSRAALSPGCIPCPCPSLRSPGTGPRPGPVSGLSALQVTPFPRSQTLQLLLVTWGPEGALRPPRPGGVGQERRQAGWRRGSSPAPATCWVEACSGPWGTCVTGRVSFPSV